MSQHSLTLWTLSLVAASYAMHEQRRLDEAREVFAETFPDDAAALVVDTTAEEATS